LAYAEDHALGLVRLETFGGDADVVGAAGQIGDYPIAVAIGGGGLVHADGGVADGDGGAGYYCAGGVMHGAVQRGGVLREGGGRAQEKREQATCLAKVSHLRLQVAQRTRGFC
jgi:hypothetical protein